MKFHMKLLFEFTYIYEVFYCEKELKKHFLINRWYFVQKVTFCSLNTTGSISFLCKCY